MKGTYGRHKEINCFKNHYKYVTISANPSGNMHGMVRTRSLPFSDLAPKI